MGVYIPSAEELAGKGGDREYTLMPEDEYLVEVKEFSIKMKDADRFHDKPYESGMAKLSVISFANGEPLVDENGDETTDRLFFDFLETEKIGFAKNGKAAKTRQFVAAALSQPVNEPIEFDSWDEMVGKRMVASVVIKATPNGKKNNVTGYRPVRRRTTKAKDATPPPPPAEDIDVVATAKEIFGGDDEDF